VDAPAEAAASAVASAVAVCVDAALLSAVTSPCAPFAVAVAVASAPAEAVAFAVYFAVASVSPPGALTPMARTVQQALPDSKYSLTHSLLSAEQWSEDLHGWQLAGAAPGWK